MITQNLPTSTGEGSEKQALNQRLEAISWALFLIMLGGIGLIPDALVPEGTWLAGVGLIMLGLNLARHLNNIPMRTSTLFLGALALIAGLASIFGVNLPIFPIALILLGLNALGRHSLPGRWSKL